MMQLSPAVVSSDKNYGMPCTSPPHPPPESLSPLGANLCKAHICVCQLTWPGRLGVTCCTPTPGSASEGQASALLSGRTCGNLLAQVAGPRPSCGTPSNTLVNSLQNTCIHQQSDKSSPAPHVGHVALKVLAGSDGAGKPTDCPTLLTLSLIPHLPPICASGPPANHHATNITQWHVLFSCL
jgi:hypothetical protein